MHFKEVVDISYSHVKKTHLRKIKCSLDELDL